MKQNSCKIAKSVKNVFYLCFGFLEKRLLDGQIQITALQEVALLLENHETMIQTVNCAQTYCQHTTGGRSVSCSPPPPGPSR